MKQLLIIILFVIPVCGITQTSSKGVKWASNVTWDEVKAKAKQENKFILIDAYATWCKPCKEMDKYVFSNDTVGRIVNDNFIPVKIQMDQTSKDDSMTRKWNAVGNWFAKKYYIKAYPTYIFLDPNSEIVHKITGYQAAADFLKQVDEALKPGKEYNDPFRLYKLMKQEYLEGTRDQSLYSFMVKQAKKIGDIEFALQLAKEYSDYLFEQGESALFQKASIAYFVTTYDVIGSNSRLFKFFYDNATHIDKVMGAKGYADAVIDKTIKYEIIDKYLGKYSDVRLMSINKDIKSVEPDWNEMFKEIELKFNKGVAKRNVHSAKVTFYYKAARYEEWAPVYFTYSEKYGVDTIGNSSYSALNGAGWTVFQMIDDQKLIQKACNLMEMVLKRYPQKHAFVDTYANLLYKAGRTEDALKWERKALELAKNYPSQVRNYTSIIEKMKKGEPTWTGRLY